MRHHGVGSTTELEYWAWVDDISIATAAALAPFVMAKLQETHWRSVGLSLEVTNAQLIA